MYFKKLLHPEFFQGDKKHDNYFEGWYYKFVSQDETKTIALIPGVSINKEDQHAFIQVFISSNDHDRLSLKTYYFRYDFAAFSYDHLDYSVTIGKNIFTKTYISIELINDELTLQGTITLSNLTPIRRKLMMPNIMGPFGYLNFMECYHGIISMTHHLNGALLLNEAKIEFKGGKGYIEKDWGKSFPRAYVWLQSNHFENKGTAFMFSYADIPFLGLFFKGLIANLVYENKEYRFATYNFTKVKVETIDKGYVRYVIKKGRWALEIEASSDIQIGLASPRNGKMIEQIKEGLSGNIHLKLFKRSKLIYEDTGYHAGIEIMK